MPDQFTDQLSAHLDGELDPLRARRLEAHLAECAECAATLADLRSIMAAAPHYPGRLPGRDLWPLVESRLGEAEVVSMADRSADRRLRDAAARFSWPQLIAASLLMTLMGAGASWLALGRNTGPEAAPIARTGPGAPGKTVAYAESQYESAVSDLTRILEEGRSAGSLDSATVRVIDESLRKIDAAIEEARAAIQRDPGNGYLNRQIAANMRRKLAILRRAADAIART